MAVKHKGLDVSRGVRYDGLHEPKNDEHRQIPVSSMKLAHT
jgi:hypothetical protein